MKRGTISKKFPESVIASPPDQQPSLFDRIYDAVRTIPSGKVSTCGRIGQYIGCSAQMVGFAMAAVPGDSNVPWHRVINHKGMISRRSDGYSDGMQRALLVADVKCLVEISKDQTQNTAYYTQNCKRGGAWPMTI